MTREDIIEQFIPPILFEEFFEKQKPTAQDKQAESEKYQKAFDDGYANGYAQARFDYDQEPCEVSEYDKDHIWYKGNQYVSLRRFLEVKAEKEPCNNAVSRDAVNTLVDELARAISDERCHIPQRGRDAGHIMHDILDLPPVNSQPKIGYWINKDFRKEEYVVAGKCTVCGQMRVIDEFCSHCGAKMIGVKE